MVGQVQVVGQVHQAKVGQADGQVLRVQVDGQEQAAKVALVVQAA